MTEQNNRVLVRRGARTLTQAEMTEVRGGYSTPILFTEQLTNRGTLAVDRYPDEEAA